MTFIHDLVNELEQFAIGRIEKSHLRGDLDVWRGVSLPCGSPARPTGPAWTDDFAFRDGHKKRDRVYALFFFGSAFRLLSSGNIFA